jgi:hypothetical protein
VVELIASALAALSSQAETTWDRQDLAWAADLVPAADSLAVEFEQDTTDILVADFARHTDSPTHWHLPAAMAGSPVHWDLSIAVIVMDYLDHCKAYFLHFLAWFPVTLLVTLSPTLRIDHPAYQASSGN